MPIQHHAPSATSPHFTPANVQRAGVGHRLTWRSKRSSIGALIVALLLCAASSASAQTGQALAVPKFAAYDSNGDPCASCKVFAYVAGTTTKQDTYTSSTLGTPNANPVLLDSAGRATIYIDPTKSYKIVLAPSTDSDPPASALWSMDPVTGQFSGTVTINAAVTRGLQISRAGANAGLSIASTGGSGKTYGFVSDTSGALSIQDDSDSTPQIKLSGNDITQTATGTLSWPTGLALFGGFGTHLFSSSGTGGQVLGVRNTTAGTGNYSQVQIGNDASTTALRLAHTSSTYTTSAPYVQDAAVLEGTRAGGLSLSATNSAGDIRLYTGTTPSERVRVDQDGRVSIGTTITGNDFEVRSTADDLSGGVKLSRGDANATLMIVNVNDGGAGVAKGVIQAGDNATYRPIALSPNGGGIEVGGGTAIVSVLTGTTSWDPPNINSASAASTTVTVTGVQSNSPCFAGISSMVASYAIAMTAHYDGAANTVRFVLTNQSGSAMDLGSGTVRVTCFTY